MAEPNISLDPASGGRAARPRSAKRSLCSIVLGFEVFIMFFFTLLAYGLELVPQAWAFPLGLGMCVLLLLAAGLLPRPAGYALGWVMQILLLAAGLLHFSMFIVGALFTAMWFFSIRMGGKLDARWADAGHEDAGAAS